MGISPDALKRLIRQGEGVSLEFKRRINHPKKIAKSMSAFANNMGGMLIIGVDDNGFLYGIEDEKYPYEQLSSISESLTDPPVKYSIESLIIDGQYIIVVNIPSSKEKPHFVVSSDKSKKTAYIRLNDKSIEATPLQIAMMVTNEDEETVLHIGEEERLLFDFLKHYGTISFNKYVSMIGSTKEEASQRLVKLISIGMIKSVYTESGEYFSLI